MRGLILLAAGAAAAVLTSLLARAPGLVERVYGQSVGPALARGLSLASGWSPVSFSFVGLVLLVGWAGWRAASGVARVRSGTVSLGQALLGGGAWVAGVAGLLLLVFYLAWGIHYARAPLGQRLGLEPVAPEARPTALVELGRWAAQRTNRAYRDLHGGSDDVGAPTSLDRSPAEVSRALEVGWRRVAPHLGMGAWAGARFGQVKTRGSSWLLMGVDVVGVYSPFLGEAHVVGSLPALSFPATAAHEQAHQRGITHENEATFAGVLVAIHSDDLLARYSGWARVLRTLSADLRRQDPEAHAQIMSTLLPGVVRDWDDLVAWHRENRGPAGPVQQAVNDAYLKAHGVPGGTLSYGRVTGLLLSWAQRHGGGLVPARLNP